MKPYKVSTKAELCKPEIIVTPGGDSTLPVTAVHDYRLRWDDRALQFETLDGLRHLDWRFVVNVSLATGDTAVTFYDQTVDVTDLSGKVHKIALSDFRGESELRDFLAVARENSTANIPIVPIEKFEEMRSCVIKFLPHDNQGADQNRTKLIVQWFVLIFAIIWVFSFSKVLGPNSLGNEFRSIEYAFWLLFAALPIYAWLSPVTQIRLTPTKLLCQSVVCGNLANRKTIAWHEVASITLTDEKPNQRVTDRELCFNLKSGDTFKIKLEQISTADNWKLLLKALCQYSVLPIESLDENLFDKINLDQDSPTYTQIWLDSLTAPARRDKLVPLQSKAPLQNGKYIVERKLGSGGQGSAYLVHTTGGATAVLKEYILPIYVDAKVRRKALENFENEARMLLQLNSPSIVKLLDFFVEDHRGYLVLEHINGSNLRDHVKTQGPVTEAKAIEYGIALCDVLIHLHNQDPPIIHRDLTPDNVILLSDDTLKVIDFMVAKRNDESVTATVVGKHAYLAPEGFRGKATTHSDIYALGCSLFFMLTGQDPEPLSPSKPSLIRETIDSELDQIVSKATAIDVTARYKSADEMKQALQTVRRKAVD